MVMLLWASKFATAKIECSFEMGKLTHLGGTIYFAVIVLINAFFNTLLKSEIYLWRVPLGFQL